MLLPDTRQKFSLFYRVRLIASSDQKLDQTLQEKKNVKFLDCPSIISLHLEWLDMRDVLTGTNFGCLGHKHMKT